MRHIKKYIKVRPPKYNYKRYSHGVARDMQCHMAQDTPPDRTAWRYDVEIMEGNWNGELEKRRLLTFDTLQDFDTWRRGFVKYICNEYTGHGGFYLKDLPNPKDNAPTQVNIMGRCFILASRVKKVVRNSDHIISGDIRIKGTSAPFDDVFDMYRETGQWENL